MRTTGRAAGTASNGNRASCRASVTPIRISRARLRAFRRSPNPGRMASKVPGRMERSDASREVAKPHLIEPRARDHVGKFALSRETADAFCEIDIGLAIAGDDPAKPRQDL